MPSSIASPPKVACRPPVASPVVRTSEVNFAIHKTLSEVESLGSAELESIDKAIANMDIWNPTECTPPPALLIYRVILRKAMSGKSPEYMEALATYWYLRGLAVRDDPNLIKDGKEVPNKRAEADGDELAYFAMISRERHS